MSRLIVIGIALLAMESVTLAQSGGARSAGDYLREAQNLYRSGQYFKAARYAFAANERAESSAATKAEAYSWVTLGLLRARLYNSASYFFIKTLQTGDSAAIRRVLTYTQDLLVHVGADVLRNYLIRHTKLEDYDSINRSSLLYALAKQSLLAGKEEKAIEYVNSMSSHSPLWPFALQLRGTAYAILGRGSDAIRDYRNCADAVDDYGTYDRKFIERSLRTAEFEKQQNREADDLKNRCLAGEARVLYQMDRFVEADRAYDRIPKASFVWTDILFEQAWSSFGRQEYNRSLGKLVSYKSPALQFVFNSEVEVLRAQSFLALCLYTDANDVINDFNLKFGRVGTEVKRTIEQNQNNLLNYYDLGKEALRAPLHSDRDLYRMMNRFIRGPYFQNLVSSEKTVTSESGMIRQFDSMQPGVTHDPGEGFPGFLDQVLKWRQRSIRLLGGAFVKNSMMDYYAILLADFDKMSFIKLEMLGRAKDRLQNKKASLVDRSRGNVIPSRRNDQFYWSFNGEFWNDELGDYVFGLESECQS